MSDTALARVVGRGGEVLDRLRDYGVYLALAVIVVFNLIFTDNFATVGNLRLQLVQVVPVAMVALGMALVIGTGGIDLSVGSVMAIAAALIPLYLGYGVWVAIAVGLLARGRRRAGQRVARRPRHPAHRGHAGTAGGRSRPGPGARQRTPGGAVRPHAGPSRQRRGRGRADHAPGGHRAGGGPGPGHAASRLRPPAAGHRRQCPGGHARRPARAPHAPSACTSSAVCSRRRREYSSRPGRGPATRRSSGSSSS